MKKYKVYKLQNEMNNKIYFGVTSMQNPEDRWNEKYRHNKGLHSDIIKFGLDNFDKVIIKDFDSKKEALLFESELIAKNNTTDSNIGYNIFTNKESHKHNKEYLKALSNRTSGENNPRFGKILSEETRRKISESSKGRHPSEETRRKMSKSQKGKILSDETKKKLSNALKGRIFSKETLHKMSESQKGRIVSEETKEKFRKRMSNTVWIYKDNKSKNIQREELKFYLEQGWIKGRGKLNKHKTDNSNYSKSASNRVWLHKDNQKTHCNKHDKEKLESLLKNGWSLGMK